MKKYEVVYEIVAYYDIEAESEEEAEELLFNASPHDEEIVDGLIEGFELNSPNMKIREIREAEEDDY